MARKATKRQFKLVARKAVKGHFELSACKATESHLKCMGRTGIAPYDGRELAVTLLLIPKILRPVHIFIVPLHPSD